LEGFFMSIVPLEDRLLDNEEGFLWGF
jgi:hypothetical protein